MDSAWCGREARAEAGAGARAMLPWLAGIGPFGFVIGVSAARAGIPPLAAWLTGPLIFAGSAQVAALALLGAGAAGAVVVVTVLAINARLVLYSAAMAPYWRGSPRWWRALAAYLIVEPSLAVGLDRYRRSSQDDRQPAHLYYLGGGLVLWAGWLATIALGQVVGTRVPAGLHLEFVVPLFLVGDLVPRLSARAAGWAAVAAAAVALAARPAPAQTGIMLAILVGVTVGLRASGDADLVPVSDTVPTPVSESVPESVPESLPDLVSDPVPAPAGARSRDAR
ncbi:AzlC family ABC transporter permease [Pseudofrankia asymbiotica]|uniref:Branched-chain amino acid ABC transporter permease n=1 Tax=Pseudofrankia asymbiotica TaxID=1834516 RepID=A0A1V2I7C4_9ACTN|nr:AzlC family ABC transporter permease [Pseudofrankia asymbiotica]ONH27105.1 hypothetical protein BL253_22645 [Pseudofrankia asymbiotica]